MEIKSQGQTDDYRSFDSANTSSTMMGSILVGTPISDEYLTTMDRELAKTNPVLSGHRGNKVDIITANGKILYGTKIDAPEYMSVKYEAGQAFTIFLNGIAPSDMRDIYSCAENNFIAKPVAKSMKLEVCKSTVAINQMDVSLGSNFFDEFNKAKNMQSLSQEFSCPYDPNMSLSEALKYIREPQPGTVTFAPGAKGSDENAVYKHAYGDTSSFTIDPQGKSEIRSADGSAVITSKDKVYTFGQREYSSPDEIRPQQMTGLRAKSLDTNDMTPKGNVFMPHLPVMPYLDNIIIYFRLGKKLSDACSLTKELKDLWKSMK